LTLRFTTSQENIDKPDALSRRADNRSGQGDNDNLVLLAPELCWIHALAGIRLEGNKHNILQEVQCSLKDDVQEESVPRQLGSFRRTRAKAQ
jgi:hypothetical protein